jgi:acyl-CoA dehydrogenase
VSGIDQLLSETAARVFADTASFVAVEQAEADGWAPALWDAVAETGLAWVSVPEAAGGSGGTLADAVEVLRVAGRHAAPVPLAETGVLGGWLLAGAGLDIPDQAVTVVPGTGRDDLRYTDGVLTGTAHRVPWARAAGRIVVLVDDAGHSTVAAVDPADVRVEPMVNLAGEPRDTVVFDGVAPLAVAPAAPGVDADAQRQRGALARTALMAGALERLEELTLEYTASRRQFGKAVGTFQAVQAHLVHGAQQSVIVSVALAAAVRATEHGSARFEIAAAKLLANQAATAATRHAHQAHGAMGMTREYPLHHLTRRLWAWRSEFGDERHWSRALGAWLVAAGPDDLYPVISGGTGALDAATPVAPVGARDNT